MSFSISATERPSAPPPELVRRLAQICGNNNVYGAMPGVLDGLLNTAIAKNHTDIETLNGLITSSSRAADVMAFLTDLHLRQTPLKAQISPE